MGLSQTPMNLSLPRLFMAIALLWLSGQELPLAAETRPAGDAPLHCLAFSPYVEGLNPDWGPPPPPRLIDQLLDRLVADTPFRCIMTYGVLPGLDYVFEAAQARGLKVIAILWLDKDSQVNSQSIAHGIALARRYPRTILRLSCGSEVRTRHGEQFDEEILRCLQALREAEVSQPIGTIDTWWEWCNRAWPCQQTRFTDLVDWVGVNIFPWWENKHSGIFPCTPADQAAAFHMARLEDLRRRYPDKEVILTEFGWPASPPGRRETNSHTGQACGVAGKAQQMEVINETLAALVQRGWSGVLFEAFDEEWKAGKEGDFGGGWGICAGTPPFACALDLRLDQLSPR